MSNEISVNNFINQKLLALIHDPPNKAWVISGEAHNLTSEIKKIIRNGKAHEKVAKFIAKQLFNMESLEENIENADSLASSIDRYLGSITYREKSIFRERNILLKNIFLPSIQKHVGNLFPKNKPELDNLINKYKKILNINNIDILRYQLFYLIYELIWIDSAYESSPSDTRNPTHSIFDHLYATAAMMNWILTFNGDNKDTRKGYLLGMDTVGVADFISKGRKVRDLWVSSYLVSALLWYVITAFIEEYGPDVVLFPSLRFNQFYAFYLLEKLRKEGIDKEVIDEVKQLVTEYIFNGDDLFEKLKIPPYPIIPGRVTLILPGFKSDGDHYSPLPDDNYFISKVKERYDEGWKRLIRALRIYSQEKRGDGFWNLVCNVLKRTEELLLIPPLKIRVRQVSVEKNEIFEKVNSKKPALKSDAWKVYDTKYRQLVSEFKKDKLVKVTPESHLKLFELTKDGKLPQFGEKSKRGYEFCTSCGVLPAVVIMPKEEEFNKLIGLGMAKDENDLTCIKKMISPGERLCPWCLVKRALGAEPRLMRVLLLGGLYDVEEIVKEVLTEAVKIEIPSTSDVASIRTFEEMIEKKDELCEDLKNEKVCETPTESRLSMWQWFNENYNKGIDLTIDPEEHWFSEEKRGYYFSLFRKHGINFPSPYYALVRADSDYLGDLLEGKLTPYLAGIIDSGDYANISAKKEEVDELLKGYLKDSASESVEPYIHSILLCIEGEKEKRCCPCAEKIYLNELMKRIKRGGRKGINENEVNKEVKSTINYFNEIFNKGRIIVTPAWHVSISSALNRGLIAEINLINKHKGFVIYAGGDDLLAMLPISEVLDFIKESRRAFAGYGDRLGNMCLEGGFTRLNNTYYPALPIVGRSYSVIVSHYADPLPTIINDSYYLLEEGKERISIDTDKGRIKKDIVIFKYQGLQSVIPLSLIRPIVTSKDSFKDIASVIELILALKRKVDEGEISTSLLYDYENYRGLITSSPLPIAKPLLEYWIKRNSSLKDAKYLVELFRPEYFTTRIEGYRLKGDLISNVVYTLRIIYGGE
ncbi:type III-B CRISPR-associated protein Cas10/Cmr2 [Stygiolobus caldivivus]|uniref:Type III-B CRISPR-associated protein Cas10/Cmr2 n=1 Tax=Stygiolobus caldivivus TaxID=2824673 RepID=A0A8D5U3S9_9CREN|nr:type III-B CRISPR-associated protein Cas10/Cmr2 [Stygiolobus caldivivus]BCU68734.1 type III-B CRISPR-associated protein Cas10/Cmr2 [Stygiolobus caldivivus]